MLGSTFIRAALSLPTPVILVGGILGGVFTPTEAAVVASAYALFPGGVAHRTLTLRKIWRISVDTVETAAVVLLSWGPRRSFHGS